MFLDSSILLLGWSYPLQDISENIDFQILIIHDMIYGKFN